MQFTAVQPPSVIVTMTPSLPLLNLLHAAAPAAAARLPPPPPGVSSAAVDAAHAAVEQPGPPAAAASSASPRPAAWYFPKGIGHALFSRRFGMPLLWSLGNRQVTTRAESQSSRWKVLGNHLLAVHAVRINSQATKPLTPRCKR